MAASISLSLGSLVWVEDQDVAWIDGEVLEVKGDDVKVLCTSGKTVVVKSARVYAKDAEAPPCGVDDMTKLAYLHEPGVLQNLRSRYDINEIYTYTGSILIAVNPFTRLPHLYDSHMMAQYKGATFGELSPHPFAVADAAYRLMINDGVSQSILVSGESGAGKTESTKQLMRYLAYMGGRAVSEGRSVEQKVLESNPVLEAFGNAKTVRNNNSSRFGKFVEIQFDQNGRISGAAIRTYLLERSRVCQVSDPERNYHCFYMLCAAPAEDLKRFKLGDPRTFHYLNQSNCIKLEGVDESKEYMDTRRAMDVVGISSEEQDAIFRVVAAVLHLGNIEFAKGKEIDSSVPKDEKSWFHLRTVAELLMCDVKALEDSLCKRVIVTRDETITKWLDPEAATVSRDALAKIVYSRLFDWLVDKINNSIGQDPHSKFIIGVLDIYGFESFKTNSFEQFCINLTNEKLQQHFNQHVFKMEQEEYTKEEINWSYIEFIDNKDILDLIEKKPGGIIALLDEACMFPRSTHDTFAQKLRFGALHFSQNQLYKIPCLFVTCVASMIQGVMEAIRISMAGYPTRRPFYEFLDRFGILAPNVLVGSTDEVTACKKLMEKVGLEGYQIGKTKKVRHSSKSFTVLRRSAIQIQSACRGELARTIYEGMRREAASLMIQRDLRMHISRKSYKELLSSATKIQTGIRGMAARNELRFRKQTRAAVIIQSHCHMFIARSDFKRLKKATLTTQCAWRGKVARMELRKLKIAAKETGALQAAKNKLEKQVEELTWRLQLEKRMRTDLEEAKSQETSKLQSALADMQLQLNETKETLKKEIEAAERAAEQAPIIQEVPVIDHELMNKITAENENLKALVSSLEKKIDETEKMYEETNKLSEERLKQATEAESNIIQLKTNMQRLHEKIADMETENQILRRQALSTPAARKILENGHHLSEETPVNEPQNIASANNFETPDSKLRKPPIDHRQHQEDVDALIDCVKKDAGFSQGIPIAAFTIYKCLLHWKSFEADRTSVFDRLIKMIGSAIENQDSNEHMTYWLSNTSTLLFLLQRSLKAAGTATPARKATPPTSLFGRMAMGFRSSSLNHSAAAAALEVVRPVEAKYPALLFKQQLTAYVEKIYGIIRDNLKEELGSLLALCIQAPRTSKGSVLRSGRSFGKDSPANHWLGIIECLNTLLCTLKENFVPPVLVQKIHTQTFSYINVQLFNSLLLRRECCTFSNGEYVKSGLAELELWCCQAKEEYAGSSWDELKHIRQAVGFLVIHQKYRISYDEIIHDLCPVLSVQQLYRICTLYWDDNYNTRSVSPDVIASMRVLMTEDSNNAESNSFLLDDSSSIPFSVEDLSNSFQVKDFSDVKPAEELIENEAFQFLRDCS
ncbi:hypothetical protein Leryth_011415 [Lithospermum erythrorhizon]|nr:hypothetical protein Leryth_011415 [Lithospermum erythrorhizon]